MEATLLRAKDYLRTPWKNGLGWTDQIAIYPPRADLRRGDFLWRISTAHIAQSAPFSLFQDHDRILVVLEGAGVKLSHTFSEGDEPEIVELPALQPYEFPGDVATHSELLDGPIQDFSIFLKKGEVSVTADVRELDEPFSWEFQGTSGFVFVARGAIEYSGSRLESGDGLRVDARGSSSSLDLNPVGQASLILIEMGYRLG